MKDSGILEPLICNMVTFHFCVNLQIKVYTTFALPDFFRTK